MRRIIIVTMAALSIALAACGSSSSSSTPETTTTAMVAVATVQECADAINVAKNNVAQLAEDAPMAVITEGSPAGAAAKLRSLSAETRRIVDNAADVCKRAGNCGKANIDYLYGTIADVEDIADTLTGGGSTATTAPGSFPETLTCG